MTTFKRHVDYATTYFPHPTPTKIVEDVRLLSLVDIEEGQSGFWNGKTWKKLMCSVVGAEAIEAIDVFSGWCRRISSPRQGIQWRLQERMT